MRSTSCHLRRRAGGFAVHVAFITLLALMLTSTPPSGGRRGDGSARIPQLGYGVVVAHAASDEWYYSFHCSSISVNNDTQIDDKCIGSRPGGVCGEATYWKAPRIYGDGSGIVYIKAARQGVGHDCPQYLTTTSCTTNGFNSRACIAHDCQVSTWGQWGSCSRSCDTGLQPRNQTLSFTIVVANNPPVLTVGKPCIAVEERRECELKECDTLNPRLKQFLLVLGITFGVLCFCTIIAGICRLARGKKKINTRTGGIDTDIPMVVYHDDPDGDAHQRRRQRQYMPVDGAGEAAQPPRRVHRRDPHRMAREAAARRAAARDREEGEIPASARYGVGRLAEDEAHVEKPPNVNGVLVLEDRTRPMLQRRDSIGSATTASTIATARGLV